jgi:predicted Zn-dependent protease
MDATASSFSALWFDGHRARAEDVELELDAETMSVRWPGTGVSRQFSIAQARVSQRLMHAPRLISVPGSGTLQVTESDALHSALVNGGFRAGRVESWERNWPAALVALVLLIAVAVYVYRVALPAAAQWAAQQIPPALEANMGDQVLKSLDRGTLQPSLLDPAERNRITREFLAMSRIAAPDADVHLVFRRAAEGDGINAFALPGGTVVLLDGLVAFAGDDHDEVLGVLAHELGHVHYRHMTRGLFQAMGGAALAGLIWGDYSSVASNAATILGVLKFTRDNEEEADQFAYDSLEKAGTAPESLSHFFDKVDIKYRGKLPPAWLSSHPAPNDRSARVRRPDKSD